MTVLARLSTADVITIKSLIDEMPHPSPETLDLSRRLSVLLLADQAFRNDTQMIGGDD